MLRPNRARRGQSHVTSRVDDVSATMAVVFSILLQFDLDRGSLSVQAAYARCAPVRMSDVPASLPALVNLSSSAPIFIHVYDMA